MDKTREEFVVFLRQAMHDRESPAYNELYQFLVACFVRADAKMQGRVDADTFDVLIETSAVLPRRYGYAPPVDKMYPTDELKREGRRKMFEVMDTENSGYITLNNWVNFAVTHIYGKLPELPKDYLGGSTEDVSRQEFIDFIRKAVDKKTPEYRELYFFLLKTFQAGDDEHVGEVGPVAFDEMIEQAAAAPRRFGLAPKPSEMFKSYAQRLAKRKEYFAVMDVDVNGTISFDEWLNYAYNHIVEKVATLPEN